MPELTAVDLFAGAGGATAGLQRAGFRVVGAIENGRDAAASYRLNHSDVVLHEGDIREVDTDSWRGHLQMERGALDLLKACPPCQGFSSLARGPMDDDRNDLVLVLHRFVAEFRPRALLLENVPGLSRDSRFTVLIDLLERLGYMLKDYVADAGDFGVPQRRRRLIVIGVLKDSLMPVLPKDLIHELPEDFRPRHQTVGEALANLQSHPPTHPDPLSRHRASSPKVQRRIEAVPLNGTRFDLPLSLQLPCHIKLAGSKGGRRDASGPYGRLRWDDLAPTMTTRCTTPSCGTFIHPTEHRGLTLREAAALQTFPSQYHFSGGYDSIERQIGNAVPVRMAEALGLVVVSLLEKVNRLRRADWRRPG